MPGRFFAESENDSIQTIQCLLCPRNCSIKPGAFGKCGVRGNKNGKGYIPFYGHITALAVDPIEKKPLYHFMPGTQILSIGFSGCNLHCPFCQNWRISQNPDAPGRSMQPREIISLVKSESGSSIAYTYSEPLIHAEFLLDCMSLARKNGIANVLVTNGGINAPAAREILNLTDAANIDLKCFSAQTYAQTLGGNLETTLEFIRIAVALGVHIELTTLIVPDLNNSAGLNKPGTELDAAAQFIAGLNDSGPCNIPWHLSAYHPDYKWDSPAPAAADIIQAKTAALKTMPFVYTGNIRDEKNDTLCPECGAALIRRSGYRIDTSGLNSEKDSRNFSCAKCGKLTPILAR